MKQNIRTEFWSAKPIGKRPFGKQMEMRWWNWNETWGNISVTWKESVKDKCQWGTFIYPFWTMGSSINYL